ncbi:hypothetical protein [Bdellovibrio bacteriovorus]|uniref:hypothetical protein n=1 Tax=Bdellovibrio TaxID=958 RepID=UPI0035A89F17
MKTIALIIALTVAAIQSHAQHQGSSMIHEMQHGFVLSADDTFASHLVANGHHSRQTEIIGQLFINDPQEMQIYQERKLQCAGGSYFLFQAQSLDLPTLSAGQVLTGHIVESKMGDYEPQNRIVKSATFTVRKILLNIPNPFFNEEVHHDSSPKRHCCDTGEKPCNWKC